MKRVHLLFGLLFVSLPAALIASESTQRLTQASSLEEEQKREITHQEQGFLEKFHEADNSIKQYEAFLKQYEDKLERDKIQLDSTDPRHPEMLRQKLLNELTIEATQLRERIAQIVTPD